MAVFEPFAGLGVGAGHVLYIYIYKWYPQNIRVAHKVFLCCMIVLPGVLSADVSGFQELAPARFRVFRV